jgi:hypothetical protein
MTIKKLLTVTLPLMLIGCNLNYSDNYDSQIIKYKSELILLDVEDIEIIDRTERLESNSKYEPPVNPKYLILNWVQDRLRAAGEKGKMEFIIEEASFAEHPLSGVKEQFLDYFQEKENNKYVGKYLLTIKIYPNYPNVEKTTEVNIEAVATKTIQGVITLANKNAEIKKMLQELIRQAEREIENNIRVHMNHFVKSK